ncbi:MAG: hypothetical protein HN348_27580 [Proteobacteria bacterium]|nr:hypothetical protein [Pseudomonadota bacterium]
MVVVALVFVLLIWFWLTPSAEVTPTERASARVTFAHATAGTRGKPSNRQASPNPPNDPYLFEELDDSKTISCPVSAAGSIPKTNAELSMLIGNGKWNGTVALKNEKGGGTWAPAKVADGWVQFPDRGMSKAKVTLKVDGFLPAKFDWSPDGCTVIELERAALISGKVEPPWEAYVQACTVDKPRLCTGGPVSAVGGRPRPILAQVSCARIAGDRARRPRS